jgi:hypothetical protein
VDRDNGMRRISSTTRWLAGTGFVLVAAFSVYFSERASSGGSSTTVNTPVATAPPATDAPSGSASTPQPVPTSPPITNPPRSHTRSSGS